MAMIYNFHPLTCEFIGAAPADFSPLEPGVVIVPAHATLKQPPQTGRREVAVFIDGQWVVKADWRNVPLFSTVDGRPVACTDIGKTPDNIGATDQMMPGTDYSWIDGEWRIDASKQAARIENIRKAAMASVDETHAETLTALGGNPTQSEKDTWAMKIAIAQEIQAGGVLSSSSAAFMDGLGLGDAAGRAEWAASVLNKATDYARGVGIADRLRSIARKAVSSAVSAQEIEAALIAQRNIQAIVQLDGAGQ